MLASLIQTWLILTINFSFDLQHNQAGLLSMAKGNDDTNDSQFFITMAAQRHLDYNHSIFGMLTEGDDVRKAIARVPVNDPSVGTPLSAVTITSATVFTDTENGMLLLKAAEGQTGSADVTVTVTDASGNTFTRTYRVNVTPDAINSNPYLSDLASNTVTTSSGAPATMALQANDVEGTTNNFYYDVVPVNSADASKFTVNVNRDTGAVTITPNAGVVGTFRFLASVRDKSATTNPTDQQAFNLVVTPSAPSAPDLVAASDSGSSDSDNITKTSNVTFTVTNVNNGAVVRLYAGNTVIATTTAVGTTATLTVSNLASLGEVATSFTATQLDGTTESAHSPVTLVTYDVTAPGNITSSPVLTARVGQTYTYNAASPNEGQSGVSYALVNPPAGVTVDSATGVISWNPTVSQIGTSVINLVVRDAAGNESTTQTFSVEVAAAIDPKIDFKLRITDLNGNTVTSLNVGDSFYLIATVKDLRSGGTGVYSFYTDITFDSALAGVNGAIIYGAAYGSAPNGNTSTPGLIDEVGSFAATLAGPGTSNIEAFRIPMVVLHAGQIRFESNAPDIKPAHEILLFGASANTAVLDEEVNFGTAAVSVGLGFVTVNDSFAVAEDTVANTLNVLSNDTITAGSGNVLTISSVTAASHGTVTIAADGKTVLYTPSANYFGPDSFTYTVRNQNNDTSIASVSLNVNNVNDNPSAVADTDTTIEDSGNKVINVLANDNSSPDSGETLTVIGVTQGSRGGVVTIGTNGQNVLYRPAANVFGEETFTYTISDGNGGTSSATVTMTITAANDNPTSVNDTGTVVEDSTANHVNVLGNDSSSPDTGETLTVLSVTQGNKGGTVAVGANGEDVLYTPAANFYGTETFTYTISDGNGGTSTATVTMTVTNTNDAPTAVNDTLQAYKNTAVVLDLIANDSTAPDPAEVLTISAVTQPAHGAVTIAADGKTVTYTATTGYTGADTFTYTLRDAGGLTSTATVNLTVLEFIPSTLSGFSYMDTNNNGVKDAGELPLAGITITLKGNDANNAVVTRTQVTAADGSYTFTNLAPGTYQIGKVQAVSLVDGKETVGSQGGTAVSNEIRITLSQGTTGTNNNFGEVSRQSSSYRKEDFYASTWRSQVVAALPATYSATGSNTALFQTVTGAGWNQLTNVVFTLVNNGASVKIDATNAQSQQITTTVSLSDTTRVLDLGTQGQEHLVRFIGSFDTFGFTVVTTNPGGGNAAPVAANDTATVNSAASVVINVATNDTDSDGTLNLASIVITQNPTNGTLTVNTNGTVTYLHNGSSTTSDTFQYTIKDSSGAVSNVATVTLTINAPANQAPVAVNDTATVAEGGTVIIPVATNDTDANGTIDLTSIVITQAPASGTVTVNADGTVTYINNGSSVTSDSFSYTIKDNLGQVSNVATVAITVTPVNDAPVAVNDTATVPEGGTVSISVATNDTDSDSTIDLTSIVITQNPTNGTVTVNANGTVTYVHNGSETTTDSFSYTIKDAQGLVSNAATVAITVTPVNDAPVAVNDSTAVVMGNAITINLAANDTDAENALDLTSIVITQAPINGTVTVNANGTVTYTHDGSETTTDTFSYTIKDASGAVSNAATVAITVNDVNTPPVAVNDSATVAEGGTISISVATNDTDVDSNLDLTSIVITQNPTHGTLTVNANGTVTYIHDGSNTTTDSFQYTIKDAQGAVSNAGSVSITVTPVNVAPVAAADSATVAEGGTVAIDLAVNDTDSDGTIDLTSIVITQAPTHGTLTVNVDGTATYVHDGSETTTDSFQYTIKDVEGGVSAAATVSITVTPVNDAPVAVNDSATVNEGASVTIDLAVNDTDVDNAIDLTSIVITQAPAHGTITVNADGTVSYLHDGTAATSDSFTYTIKDAAGLVSNVGTVSITVTPVNTAPVAVADSATVNEGASVTIDLAANDTDSDSTIDLTSIVITQAPTHGTITVNADGTVSYLHDGSETTTDSFSYTIKDAQGLLSNAATVSITVTPVNDAPVAVADSATVNEGASIVIDLALNDTDVDNALDLTSIIITQNPAHGTITVNTDGTVSYLHDGTATTTDSFSYTIKDAAGLVSNVGTVAITVTPVNTAPVAVNDSATVSEGASVTIDLAANDTDVDNALDLTSIIITQNPASGTITVNADGTVSYLHDGSATTTDSFSYTIKDAAGLVSNVGTVAITVTPVNDAPVASAEAATVNEGASIVIDLAVNDTDSDGTIDLTSIVVTQAPAHGTVTVNADGTVTYLHNGSETTTDSFEYTIKDNAGLVSAAATVNITVTPVNDAPVAANDAASVVAGGTVSVDLATNDTDADSTIDLTSIVITQNPANGTITVNNDGTVSYTHDGTATTSDSFAYTIKDAQGLVSNAGTVAITVTAANVAPVAVADSATVNEGVAATLDLAANDTDSDGTLDLTSIVITQNPAHGTVTVNNDGTVSYAHDGSETTSDSFSYTIKDNAGLVSAVALVSVTVTPVNDAPVAVDDAATVAEGGNVNIVLVLNDTDVDSDLDLTSIVITQDPTHGTITVNGDGTVTYTHDGSDTTSDWFEYTIKDAEGLVSETAIVAITVTPVNDAPVAANDSATVDEAGTVAIDLAVNDTDTDSTIDLTSIVIVQAPLNGTLTINPNGTVSYTHDGSATTSDSFTYTIKDAEGAVSNVATVSLTIVPPAEGEAFGMMFSMPEGEEDLYDLLVGQDDGGASVDEALAGTENWMA